MWGLASKRPVSLGARKALVLYLYTYNPTKALKLIMHACCLVAHFEHIDSCWNCMSLLLNLKSNTVVKIKFLFMCVLCMPFFAPTLGPPSTTCSNACVTYILIEMTTMRFIDLLCPFCRQALEGVALQGWLSITGLYLYMTAMEGDSVHVLYDIH